MEDELTWKRIRKEIAELKNLTEGQTQRLLNGWSSLEKALGTEWLPEAVLSKHPWIRRIRSGESWTKSYYALIGEKIGDLRGVSGIDNVVQRIGNPRDPVSAVAEINAGWKLYKGGIKFRFVPAAPPDKTPDIRAFVDRKQVSVEVTVLRMSQTFMSQFERISSVSKTLSSPQVCSAGRIYKDLSQRDTKHINEMVIEATEKALLTDKQVVIPYRDIAEFCIAPLEHKDDVELWKTNKGIDSESSLMAHDFETDQGRRLRQRFYKKQEQFGDNTPGILYIEGFRFTIGSGYIGGSPHFEREYVERSASEIQDLLFVVLNSIHIGRPNAPLARRLLTGDYIAIKNVAPDLIEYTWLIPNRNHTWQHLRHKKLIRAFWHRGRSDPREKWLKGVSDDLVRQMGLES